LLAQQQGLRRALFHRLILHPSEPRRMVKANSVFSPLNVFGGNIFSYKNYPSGTANELGQFRFRFGSNQRQYRCAIRRSNRQPSITRLQTNVERQAEAKLIEEKTQAALLVADKDI